MLTEEYIKARAAFLECFTAACEAQNLRSKVRLYELPELDEGIHYDKVVRCTASGRSVYCFISRTDGVIFKPAGWKRPAKGPRGTIFDASTYSHLDVHGGWLYRSWSAA